MTVPPIETLRTRVMFERPVTAADALGGVVATFTPAGAAFAAVEPEGATLSAAQDGAPVTLRWLVTLRAPSPVAVGWRVAWANGAARVRAVQADAHRIVLICEEDQA